MLRFIQIAKYYSTQKKSKKYIIKKIQEIVRGINHEFILSDAEILKLDEILKSETRTNSAFLTIGL